MLPPAACGAEPATWPPQSAASRANDRRTKLAARTALSRLFREKAASGPELTEAPAQHRRIAGEVEDRERADGRVARPMKLGERVGRDAALFQAGPQNV